LNVNHAMSYIKRERQSFIKTCKAETEECYKFWRNSTLHLTSAQAVDTDKTSFQNYPQPDDHTRRNKLIIVIWTLI